MKRIAKLLALALALCLSLSMLPLPAQAAIVDGGTLDAGPVWTLDDQGTLTISGEGGMMFDFFFDLPPWKPYKEKFRKS